MDADANAKQQKVVQVIKKKKENKHENACMYAHKHINTNSLANKNG